MSDVELKVFVGENFKVEGQSLFTTNSNYLNRKDVFYDERGRFLTRSLNLSNWDWYYNYLDFTQVVANKNQSAKPNYLLDLGYVPVVFLPTCCLQLGSKLMEVMDKRNIPYVKVQPMSFVTKYCDIMSIDAWVSKMDASELLGIAPEKVTSIDILRRLILNE